MRRIVYTCVFGGYDWVFPPVQPEADLAYAIVTDDTELHVPGWQSLVVEADHFRNGKTANLHYRALGHEAFSEYDCSLYVDGNIRLLGRISEFFEDFLASGAALGLFPHPLRSTVQEEAEICLRTGKVNEPDRLEEELSYYSRKGFPDTGGLIETTIILKNHKHPDLARSMKLWWTLFERFGTRDQISLPYVLWRARVPCMYQSYSFRDPNPYFGRYTHRMDRRAPRHYAYVEGRAYDNLFFAVMLRMWHFSWSVRRVVRKRLKAMRSG